MRILDAPERPDPPRIYSMSLAPFLTRHWGHFWLSWTLLGPFNPVIEPLWHPNCCLQAITRTTKPPNSHFASFVEAPCFQKSAKTMIFLRFLNVFASSAFGHLAPPKQAFQTQDQPEDGLLEHPRERPRRAQHRVVNSAHEASGKEIISDWHGNGMDMVKKRYATTSNTRMVTLTCC